MHSVLIHRPYHDNYDDAFMFIMTCKGAVCPQDLRLTNRFYSPFQLKSNVMNENCLFLNVWTPTLNSVAKLPVMIWIYGGYYKIGNSQPFFHKFYTLLTLQDDDGDQNGDCCAESNELFMVDSSTAV